MLVVVVLIEFVALGRNQNVKEVLMTDGCWYRTFAYKIRQRVILRLVTCTDGSSSLSLNALSSRSNGWRTNIIVTPGHNIKVSFQRLLAV